MSIDVLVLNTIVTDLRRGREFEFVDELAGEDGLRRCETSDMPNFTQADYARWVREGSATAGGPGNSAPLMTRAGLNVAVAGLVGKGDYNGFDAAGEFFKRTMTDNGVDTTHIFTHPELPTGTTFIHNKQGNKRGGIAYFPNANNAIDFVQFMGAVQAFNPKIVYYMYSGLSENGDANNGKELAKFMSWCRERGAITMADSHTLTPNPKAVIRAKQPVEEYKLLAPLLPFLDIFFTSSDEARMIANTNHTGDFQTSRFRSDKFNKAFIEKTLADNYHNGTAVFGVTYSDGAYYGAKTEKASNQIAARGIVRKVNSNFLVGKNIDLVGAGDAFRAGFLTYVSKNHDDFTRGTMNFGHAVQMGNLFAALYIKSPLNDRYSNIGNYQNMLKAVETPGNFRSLTKLLEVIK